MSLDKNLKIVIHFLSQWPRTVSTSEIVKEIKEVIKDLRDEPYQTYLFIQFVKNYINLAPYPGKYQNKNFVEVFSKSLLGIFIHDEEEREVFYKKYIQDNPLNKNFHQLGAQFVEQRWIYLSVESDALRELNKELDEIIIKHPLVRLLEESNKKNTTAMKAQKPAEKIAIKPTLINFLLLIPVIFSQLPTSRAQEFSKNASAAITTDENLDLMNSVIRWEHCPNNFTLNEELEKYSKYVTVDFDSAYPFHRIVRLGLMEIAEIFLERKIDIEVRDNEQRTPLHIASAVGNLEMVKFLWMRGANVNVEDKEEWTPLHWATSHGHKEVIKELLSHDPIIKGVNEESIRPFTIAINHEYYEIAQLFLDHMEIGAKINTAAYKKLKKSEKLIKDRHFSEALVIFNDFLKVEPPLTNFEEHIFWASVVHRRSHLNVVLNNVKAALDDLEYIIKLYPQRSVSAHYLYVDLLVQQNKFELALKAISKGLYYFPDHILLLQLQAEIYQKIGDSFFRLKDKNYLENYKKALENYQKALQLDPENQLYKELVIVATYLSDHKNTLEYYQLHHAEFSVESILKNKIGFPSTYSPTSRQMVPRKNNKLVQCSEKFINDSNMNKFQDLYEQGRDLNLNNKGVEAIRKLQNALEVARELVKDPCFNLYISAVYTQLMRAYILINDYEQALEAHHLSLYFAPVLPAEEKNTAFEAYTNILQANIKNDLKFNEGEIPENIDLLEKVFFAAATDNIATLQLLKTQVNINQQNAKGATPLLVAVRHNRLEALKELIKVGADVNIEDFQGRTAMHLAAMEGNSEAIKILAAAGANLESLDHSEQEPFNIAIGKGYKEAAQVLFNKIGGESLPEEIFASLYEIEKATLPIPKVLERRFILVVDWLYNKNNPQFNNILNRLFIRYFSKKNTQDITTPEAVKMLDKALQLFPKDNRLLVLRVMQLASQKKYQETINKCKEVIQINPDALLPHFYLANHCINLGDYRAMEKHYEKILPPSSFYEEAQEFLNQFRDFFKESNTLEAILARDNSDIIEKIDLSEKPLFLHRIFQPSLNPAELIHDLRNVSLAIKINNWWAAQLDLAKANDDKSLIVREEILNQIIETLKQENDAYYNLALSNAYGNLGFIYLQLNLTGETRLAKAKYAFEIAMALGTPRADVYFAYGDMVLKGSIKHAYRAFKKAVNLAPQDLYYQKKLNELIEVFKKMNQPLPDEEPETLIDKSAPVKAEKKSSWLAGWGLWLTTAGGVLTAMYYLWRKEAIAAKERQKIQDEELQRNVLTAANLLTSKFYQQGWQNLGENVFKLANIPQSSIPTYLLTKPDLKTALQSKATFTINSDTLETAIVEALQKIFGMQSVSLVNNEFILTITPNYSNQSKDAIKDLDSIAGLYGNIINKLAEDSPQFASIKRIEEEQEYLRQFKALSSRLKEHEEKLVALAEMRDLLLNHVEMLKTIEQDKMKADQFDNRNNKDLKRLNDSISKNVSQLIKDIRSFIESNKSSDISYQDALSEYAKVFTDSAAEVKRAKKSEKEQPVKVDLKNIKNTLTAAEKYYKKTHQLIMMYAMYELKVLISATIAKRTKLLSELPEQSKDKLKPEAKPKAPTKPKVPLTPETKESKPSNIENQKDQGRKKTEKKQEVIKEDKQEEKEEEKKEKKQSPSLTTPKTTESEPSDIESQASQANKKAEEKQEETKDGGKEESKEEKREEKKQPVTSKAVNPDTSKRQEKLSGTEGVFYHKKPRVEDISNKKKSSAFFGHDPKESDSKQPVEFFLLLPHQILRIENIRNDNKKLLDGIENDDLKKCIISHTLLYCLLRMLEAIKNQVKGNEKYADFFRILRNMSMHNIFMPDWAEIIEVSRTINVDWKEKIINLKRGDVLDIDELMQMFKDSGLYKFYVNYKSPNRYSKADAICQSILGNITDLTRIVKDGWDEVMLRNDLDRLDASLHCVALIGHCVKKLQKKCPNLYNELLKNENLSYILPECWRVRIDIGHSAKLLPDIIVTKLVAHCRAVLKDLPEPLLVYEKHLPTAEFANPVEEFFEVISELASDLTERLTSVLTRKDLLTSENYSKFKDTLRTVVREICQNPKIIEDDKKIMIDMLLKHPFTLENIEPVNYCEFKFDLKQFLEICDLIETSPSSQNKPGAP